MNQPAWFIEETLEMALNHCVRRGIISPELVGYTENLLTENTRDRSQRIRFLSQIVMLMVFEGSPDQALILLEKHKKLAEFQGLRPMCMAIQGKRAEALVAFEIELAGLRKLEKRRTMTYTGGQGIIFLFLYLLEGSPEALQKGAVLAKQTGSKKNADSLSGDAALAFQAMFASRMGQDKLARKHLGAMHLSELRSYLAALVLFLAKYMIFTKLDTSTLSHLKTLQQTFRDNGARWLAVENGVLLLRAGRKNASLNTFIQKTETETGITSLIRNIHIEELWERSLNALLKAGSPDITPTAGQAMPDTRLIWCVSGPGNYFRLSAREQKHLRNGSWSKGREVSLKRLKDFEIQNLTPADEALCSTIESSDYYDSRSQGYYTFNWAAALPALIGHPHIVQAQNLGVPVEFIAAEPEVEVRKNGKQLSIRLSALPEENAPYTAMQETPTRYKVIRWTDKSRELASILGTKGLDVPEDASDRVLQAIAGISSHITVQSDIGGVSENLPSVEGDSTPIMHLLPAGSGFRAEMFVRPFVDAGPYLKPSQGTVHVIAEVNGQKTQAVRDLEQEKELADRIEEHCPVLLDAEAEEGERHWILDGPESCLELLLALKREQEAGGVQVLWPEGEKLKLPREATFQTFDLKVHKKRDWFELSGDLKIGEETVMSMKSLLELIRATPGKFIPLGEDTFLTLSQKLRRRLEELDAFSESRGKGLRINPLAALALEGLEEEFSGLETDEHWKARFETIRSVQNLNPKLPSPLKAELRDYQLDGFKWLSRMAAMELGACLADDMGLGKTVQALALILSRAPQGPTLVVAPTSVCANWQDEAEKFAPTLTPILFGGKNRQDIIRLAGPMDLVVCSYGLLQQEIEMLQNKKWQTIVLDEAQAIKNATTKRNRAAMALDSDFRIITTGTPLENHLSELHALFSFINPGLLGSRKRFSEQFAVPVERDGDKEARRRLRKLVHPFILRRIKSEVLEELPARTDVVLKVSMSEQEAAFYEAVRLQSLETLEQVSENPGENHLRILAEITRLRQAACNPRLVMGETKIPSAKLEAFGNLVEELRNTGHKALVFSQFVSHLKLIREFLEEKNIDYRYLDGSTPQAKRKKEVAAFQAGQGDLFLISLKAGGTGLNLTAADYVIHMDPWWNPAVEDQASDRAHRIGQERPVTVYRLVGRGTIEEKIVKMHQEKRDLANSLLEGTDMAARVTAEDLVKLIRGEEI